MSAKFLYIVSGLSIIIASLIHMAGLYELSFWMVTISAIVAIRNFKDFRNMFLRILWILIMVIIILIYNPLLGYKNMYALMASVHYTDWNIILGILLILRSIYRINEIKPVE